MTFDVLAAAEEVRRVVEDPRFDEITVDAGELATNLLVKRPKNFRRDDVVHVTRTGEMFGVNAVADHLVVTRGIAGTVGCPLRAGDEILISGHVQR